MNDAHTLLSTLKAAGLSLRVTPTQTIQVQGDTSQLNIWINTIKQHKPALIEALRQQQAPIKWVSRNAYLSDQAYEQLHFPCWSSDEVSRFELRHEYFIYHGLTDAEANTHAERLTLRDRLGQTTRLCLECRHCLFTRCKKNQPLTDAFHRCPSFAPLGI